MLKFLRKNKSTNHYMAWLMGKNGWTSRTRFDRQTYRHDCGIELVFLSENHAGSRFCIINPFIHILTLPPKVEYRFIMSDHDRVDIIDVQSSGLMVVMKREYPYVVEDAGVIINTGESYISSSSYVIVGNAMRVKTPTEQERYEFEKTILTINKNREMIDAILERIDKQTKSSPVREPTVSDDVPNHDHLPETIITTLIVKSTRAFEAW